jgi:uracil phosphoribosyltransferase
MKKKVNVISHPIIQHKLSLIRNRTATPHEFRQIFSELARILAYECTRDLRLTPYDMETPIQKTKGHKVGEELVVACILRAAEGMLPGFLEMLPFAKVGHIGIYRDKFLNQTVEYYFKLPLNVKGKRVLMLDPLLATGDTALAALERLKQYEVGPIKVITLLSCKLGIKKVQEAHPDVEIYTLSIEDGLNEKGYLLPGLGDAGDRLFGTV